MGEAQQKLKEFLENAVKRRNEPETPEEKREKIHKRMKNEKGKEQKKFGL